MVRVLFGLVFGVDAVLKWLPGYRHTYLAALKSAAASQPGWLHGWFHFWITLQSKAPTSFAILTGLAETSLALVLLLGVARRAGYVVGVGYSLLVWSVGEGFGGPYASGSTDVGTGIVYALLFVTLLTFSPPARRERLSLDRILVARWGAWRHLAEPHAVDRVAGAPIIEPVAVGTR
jgi:thiosulfate dehydrogenase [quinone] large subunit